jgi:hypothetical protein
METLDRDTTLEPEAWLAAATEEGSAPLETPDGIERIDAVMGDSKAIARP